MISTVLLDVDNTLLDFNACALASMQDAFRAFDLPFSKEVVFPTFLRINDQLWAQIEEGNLTKREHYQIRWNLILKELGIDFDGIRLEEKFVKDCINMLYRFLALWNWYPIYQKDIVFAWPLMLLVLNKNSGSKRLDCFRILTVSIFQRRLGIKNHQKIFLPFV